MSAPNTPPVFKEARNLDLAVRSAQPFQVEPVDWIRESWIKDGRFAIGPNEGVAPKDLDVSTFTDMVQMANYEMGAYETYGDARCEAEGIKRLDDLFGSEFSERFFKRKRQLNAEFHLAIARKELERLQARIAVYEAQARGEDVED